MKKVAIFDIDNCISDDSRRVHLIRTDTTDVHEMFRAYHEASGDDDFYHGAIIAAHSFAQIYFVTARPAMYRKITHDWLVKHGFKNPSIIMRPDGDWIRTPVFKARIAAEMVRHGCKIVAAFDDRRDVVDAYKAINVNGIRLFIHDYDNYT